jgi:hypothetical protein
MPPNDAQGIIVGPLVVLTVVNSTCGRSVIAFDEPLLVLLARVIRPVSPKLL